MNKNPGLAALLSFFIAGAGQIYNGNIFSGILINVSCYAFTFFSYTQLLSIPDGLIGAITCSIIGLIIYIYGINDAYKVAKQKNEKLV